MPSKKDDTSIESLLALASDEIRHSVTRGNVLSYQPYPKQENFHRSMKPGRYVAGGNRAGKTDSEVVEMIWWASDTHPFQERPSSWGHGAIQCRFVVVDIVKGVEKIILPKLKRWIATSMLKNGSWEESWDNRTLTLTLSNDSTIEFLTHQMGLDKHGGVPIHVVAFDEEPPQDVFNENMQRLIDYDGIWFMAATPVQGMGWTYDLLWEPAQDPEDKVSTVVDTFQLRQEDNPYLLSDKEERFRFFIAMDDEERSIREEGAFVARSGLVFPNFDKTTHVLPEPFLPPRGWRWFSSVDFGWANPTAWLWTAACEDGRIITFAEHYQSKMTTPEHASLINAREREWRRIPDLRVGDPAGNQKQMNTGTSVISEYAASGIFIGTDIPREVMTGVEKLQQYFMVQENGPWGPNTARWMISPNCSNLVRELKRLRWASYESSKKQYEMNAQEQIHKKDDHAFDSIRYLASIMPDLAPERTVATPPVQHLDFASVMLMGIENNEVASGWQVAEANEADYNREDIW